MAEEISMRMLGQTFSLTRSQWAELSMMLDPQSPYDKADALVLAGRIDDALAKAAARS